MVLWYFFLPLGVPTGPPGVPIQGPPTAALLLCSQLLSDALDDSSAESSVVDRCLTRDSAAQAAAAAALAGAGAAWWKFQPHDTVPGEPALSAQAFWAMSFDSPASKVRDMVPYRELTDDQKTNRLLLRARVNKLKVAKRRIDQVLGSHDEAVQEVCDFLERSGYDMKAVRTPKKPRPRRLTTASWGLTTTTTTTMTPRPLWGDCARASRTRTRTIGSLTSTRSFRTRACSS